MSDEAGVPDEAPIVAWATNATLLRRVDDVGEELGAPVVTVTDEADEPAGAVLLVVVELGAGESLDVIERWASRRPDVPLVGVLTLPAPDLWRAAEEHGADLVVTHGSLRRQVPEFVRSYRPATDGSRRLRIGAVNDFAGRLGHLATVEDDTVGEIALFRIGYEIHAVANRCPHAGVRLANGDLEGPVLTCPGHGSQFDIPTGARTRGPSDDPIATYRVVIEGGDLLVEVG